jgi:hypothetical protein
MPLRGSGAARGYLTSNSFRADTPYREADAACPARTRILSSGIADVDLILSVVEKLAPGSSHSGAPAALTTGLFADSPHDVSPVELARVTPEFRLSTAISNGPPIACV